MRNAKYYIGLVVHATIVELVTKWNVSSLSTNACSIQPIFIVRKQHNYDSDSRWRHWQTGNDWRAQYCGIDVAELHVICKSRTIGLLRFVPLCCATWYCLLRATARASFQLCRGHEDCQSHRASSVHFCTTVRCTNRRTNQQTEGLCIMQLCCPHMWSRNKINSS